MSVNWDWKAKKSYIIAVDDWNGKTYKMTFYQANCLGCMLYEYKDPETKKPMYNFMGFWNDLTHLKRCLGLIKDFEGSYDNIHKNFKKVVLNTYYKDVYKMADCFVKAGIKVELYYKDVNKKGGRRG